MRHQCNSNTETVLIQKYQKKKFKYEQTAKILVFFSRCNEKSVIYLVLHKILYIYYFSFLALHYGSPYPRLVSNLDVHIFSKKAIPLLLTSNNLTKV